MHEMFRPPVNRAMRAIDPAFFQKTIQITAARIFENSNIAPLRSQLEKSNDSLHLRLLRPIQPDPEKSTKNSASKCLLLRPGIKHDDATTWSDSITKLVNSRTISLIPYELRLNYEHWSAHEILSAVLPEETLDEIPTGISIVGHVAHLNLREECLPYKNLIAQVILDKNSSVRTVINKTDTLGEENQFRILEHEVLAGDNDLQVFWNSRLHTEHKRLIDTFTKGEAVCDVMAGVGPFAVPAGKFGIFVYANDLNPDCYSSLENIISLNKVGQYVRAFNEDGHSFIPRSAKYLLESEPKIQKEIKLGRREQKEMQATNSTTQTFVEVPVPRTFSHYVMNLPSTAIDFLPDFIGLYAGHEELFAPNTEANLPLVHVYCFAPPVKELQKSEVDDLIWQRVSEKIEYTITRNTPDTDVAEVRDVAPNKSQYCVTFRIPAEVAFRSRSMPNV